MTLQPVRLGRAFLVTGLIALALSACGRRGPLEAPVASATGAPAVAEAAPGLVTPTPTAPTRARRTPITVPKDPFILDSLL